jgi:hypothetical protein
MSGVIGALGFGITVTFESCTKAGDFSYLGNVKADVIPFFSSVVTSAVIGELGFGITVTFESFTNELTDASYCFVPFGVVNALEIDPYGDFYVSDSFYLFPSFLTSFILFNLTDLVTVIPFVNSASRSCKSFNISFVDLPFGTLIYSEASFSLEGLFFSYLMVACISLIKSLGSTLPPSCSFGVGFEASLASFIIYLMSGIWLLNPFSELITSDL